MPDSELANAAAKEGSPPFAIPQHPFYSMWP